MADTRAFAGGLITYWWVPDGGIANINAPTPAEVNAGVNMSRAIAVDGTEVGPEESSDIDDRSIVDAGNAVEAGFDQYAAAITAFRPVDPSDTNDPYAVLYNLFKTQRVKGYIVKRRLVAYDTAAAAGDVVSVFKVMSDYTANDTAGEDSVKLIVQFLPQGGMKVNTIVKSADPVVVTPSTVTYPTATVYPQVDPIVATLEGWDITQGTTWTSSDTDVATVSENGVITSVASGTATITATHPSAGSAGTVTVTNTP